jgi:hypothetical protein
LPIPAAVLKVSQKAGGPPSCIPQFPLTGGFGVDVGGGADPNAADAEQIAVVPPLEPPQLHVHGPEPAMDDDVPVEQRLVVGADDTCVPFADPHVPLTATTACTATVVLATEDVPPAPVQVSV